MERNIRKIALVNMVVMLLAGISGLLIARYTQTVAGLVSSVFFGIGFLITLVSYFQMRLAESERLEQLEFEELNKQGPATSLFASQENEILPARQSREQFERFFVPGFALVLVILQGLAAVLLWNWMSDLIDLKLRNLTFALTLLPVLFLALFLLGKYSANLARAQPLYLLRPGASYLVLSAYLSAITIGAILFVWGGFDRVDLWVGRALALLLGALAIEGLATLVLELYRPRVRGKRERTLYESRFVGLLAHPGGLFSTAAHALDYQFGFKVSETWFYKFLQRALGWLILIQFAVLILSTSFIFVGPGEQALIERFGRPAVDREPLGPGLHLKMPWPIDKVYRAQTAKVQSFNIGFVEEGEQHQKAKTLVWTVSHYDEEFNMLVASRQGAATADQLGVDQGVPADLITVSIPVQYRIGDLHSWTYNHADPGAVLEDLATREVVRYLVSVDIFDVMAQGRSRAAEHLQQRIQERARELNLGVELLLVGLQDIHPPVKVASAFEDVVGATQTVEAELRRAEGYAARTVEMASATGNQRVRQAEAYAARTVAEAQARANRFTHQISAYEASPQVFQTRAYLQTLEQGATNTRKYVIAATNTQEVVILNLEEELRPDLLGEVGLPPEEE